MDAMKSLRYCTFMKNKQKSRPRSRAQSFWYGPKFQAWEARGSSSLIIVRGTYTTRYEIKDFCVDAISLLKKSNAPVVWILKTVDIYGLEAPSIIDVVKDLISQVLRLNIAFQSERSLALSCTRFRGAETEDEWFRLLAACLAELPQVYMIVDVEAVGPRYIDSHGGFSWPSSFLTIFQEMSARGLKTIVKVVLVSYGSSTFHNIEEKEVRDFVIPVTQTQIRPLAARISKPSTQRKFASLGRVGKKSRLGA